MSGPLEWKPVELSAHGTYNRSHTCDCNLCTASRDAYNTRSRERRAARLANKGRAPQRRSHINRSATVSAQGRPLADYEGRDEYLARLRQLFA